MEAKKEFDPIAWLKDAMTQDIILVDDRVTEDYDDFGAEFDYSELGGE